MYRLAVPYFLGGGYVIFCEYVVAIISGEAWGIVSLLTKGSFITIAFDL
jgi:hypothetical protein